MRQVWMMAGVMAMGVAVVQAETDGFKTALSAGASVVAGNSKTTLFNATLATEAQKATLGSLRAGINVNYGENTVKRTVDGVRERRRDTSVENVHLFANVRKTLSEKAFAYTDGSLLYDDIAQVDYRAIIGPGLGVYLVKNKKTSLSIELGAAYVFEKVDSVSDDYMAVRAAERMEHRFSDTARIWQSAEYLPKADDVGDFILNAELGSEAAMNAWLNLRVVLQNKHDSMPGGGGEKNDLALIAGVSIAL